MNARHTVSAVIVSLIVGFFVVLLLCCPVMWLWNWLMPVIFGLPKIGLLQTLGLLVLSGLLFHTGVRVKSS